MKKFGFFAFVAAGLLLGACSSEIKDDNTIQGGDYTDGAYIGISLQLPSAAPATRANEEFEDGEEDEFAVKNATVYLFQGTTEAGATYLDQYAIGTDFTKDQFDDTETDNAPNITSTYCEATLITNELANKIKTASGYVYAYVVVNHNDLIPALAATETFATFSQRQFNAIGSPIAAKKNIGEGGLLMTSSPICDEQGGSVAAPTDAAKYHTLIVVDKDKIFPTAEEAKESPAACIYVERAAVKVTVTSNPTTTTLSGTTTPIAIDFQGWQIINYEPKFYNTRQVEPDWGDLASDAKAADFATWIPANAYRFVSNTQFNSQIPGYAAPYGSHTLGYRTYFAHDLQYDADATLSKTVAAVDAPWMASGDHGYTTENTFDVAHMTHANTTQVTLKYQFGDGSDFYTLNGGNVRYDETGIKNLLVTNITNVSPVGNALKAAVDELAAMDPGKTYVGHIEVSFTTPDKSKDGVVYTATYKISSTNGGTYTETSVSTATAQDLTDALDAAVASFSISFHKGGVAYYNVRIKHFGEYETPWSSTTPYMTQNSGETIQEIYGTDPDATKRFLGRYGVVRDNWYKLVVSGVKHIGTAEPVDVSGETLIPDDEIDNYISIHVHILPWVIRNQEVDL